MTDDEVVASNGLPQSLFFYTAQCTIVSSLPFDVHVSVVDVINNVKYLTFLSPPAPEPSALFNTAYQNFLHQRVLRIQVSRNQADRQRGEQANILSKTQLHCGPE